MKLISDLGFYFSIEEIQLITNNLSKYNISDDYSFQQISQADKNIKFDFGFVLNDSIFDITYTNKLFEKNIIKIKDICSLQTQESINSFRLNIYIPDNKVIWYTASSINKIQKLKDFADYVEKLYLEGNYEH